MVIMVSPLPGKYALRGKKSATALPTISPSQLVLAVSQTVTRISHCISSWQHRQGGCELSFTSSNVLCKTPAWFPAIHSCATYWKNSEPLQGPTAQNVVFTFDTHTRLGPRTKPDKKLSYTPWCSSPRKSLVKGERLVRYEEKPESVEPLSSQAAQDPICPSLRPRGWLLVACRGPNPSCRPRSPSPPHALSGVSEIRAWEDWKKGKLEKV